MGARRTITALAIGCVLRSGKRYKLFISATFAVQCHHCRLLDADSVAQAGTGEGAAESGFKSLERALRVVHDA
jgi:hypothetical protein